MVAVGGESPLDLHGILKTLESKSSSADQRLDAYTTLTGHLTEGELSLFEHDIQAEGKLLLHVAKQDIPLEGGVLDLVAQKALHVMSHCLHDTDIIRFVPPTEVCDILKLLCNVATKCQDKTTCTRALWCLSRQNISADIISGEVTNILATLEKTMEKWRGQSVIVDHEAIAVINRLCEQCAKQMDASCAVWGRLVLSQLLSCAPKVRDRAMECVQKNIGTFSSNRDLIRSVALDIKSHIGPEMKRLFESGQEVYTLRVWGILLRVLKEELNNTSLINQLLPVIELAFRHSSQDVRIHAFRAWRLLIDIFTENPNLQTDQRRVKLIMQAFTTSNTKTEAAALEKFALWWHYVLCLGTRLWLHFDQVLKPLLQFCLGNTLLGVSSGHVTLTPTTPKIGLKNLITSPATPRVNLTSSYPPQLPVFTKLQECGLQVLAHLLRCQTKMCNLPAVSFTLEALHSDVSLPPASFVKNANLLLSAVFELIKCLNKNIAEPLLLYIWQSLIIHFSAALDSSMRTECREPLSYFLCQFQVLVLSQTLSNRLIMKLFQHVCSLPKKVLSSTAFNTTSGEVVKGCPVQFLCDVLLSPCLMKECANHESFMSLLSCLIHCGTSHLAGVLEFCQYVVELLHRGAQFLPVPEGLWRMWSIVANTVQNHISQTSEVNQGDSLEYNFDCLYSTLLLPITHHLGARVSAPVCKTLMKTWSELYRTFARLSALVTNAEANVVIEDLSFKISETLKERNIPESAALLEYLMSICNVMVDTIDFSSLTPRHTLTLSLSPSPSKWTRRRHKPMGNLHSFVCLVAALMEAITEKVKDDVEEQTFIKQKTSEEASSLNAATNTCLDILSVLVSHVSVSFIIGHMLGKLSAPIAHIITATTKKSSVKLHTPAFLQKLEKFWKDFCTMVQSRFAGPYDNELLNHLSSLFVATLLHPRRQIKNQSVLLWNATFSRSSTLVYPPELKSVLHRVKEKTQILLPGWTTMDVTVIEESPVSQMSQMDSMPLEPVIPGMPSPVRIHGSFLKKDVSPKPTSTSPFNNIRRVEPRPFESIARKNLAVDFQPKEEFVVITNPPKKRQILTEHQKEMMKEKGVIPAMYNNLDVSQDVSLMSHLSSDTQQESLLVPPVSSDYVILINSSQSQDLNKEVCDYVQNLLQESKVSEGASSNIYSSVESTPPTRRSKRQKVVHFEDTSSNVNVAPSNEKLNTVKASEKNEHSFGSGKRVRRKKNKELTENSLQSSTDSTPQMPSPQPNLLGVLGEKLVDTVSSKELSLSASKTSSGSSLDEGHSKNLNGIGFQPFRFLSQSPLMIVHTPKPLTDNSLGQSTRKAKSQDVMGESERSPTKGSGIKTTSFPACTSLEMWLKKRSPASEVLSNQTGCPTKINLHTDNSSTFVANSDTLVTDTQSPKKLICNSESTDISILESPLKTSSSSNSSSDLLLSAANNKLSTLFRDSNNTAPDEVVVSTVHHFKKPPCTAELCANESVVPAASDSGEGKLLLTITPPPLCEEVATQGFCPETNCSSAWFVESKVTEIEPAEDNLISVSKDHMTLFGFSELLSNNVSVEETKETKNNEDNSDRNFELYENLPSKPHPLMNEEECHLVYNPESASTLRDSLPSEHSSVQNSPSCNCTDSSPNLISVESAEMGSNFDPLGGSTLLQDSASNNRRKQPNPKKMDAPLKLCRAQRKSKSKKSLCACCKDGTSPSHTKSPKRRTSSRQKKSAKMDENSSEHAKDFKEMGISENQTNQKIASVQNGEAIHSLHYKGSNEVQTDLIAQEVTEEQIGKEELTVTEEPLSKKESEISEKLLSEKQSKVTQELLGEKESDSILSPQELLGEKTPELKGSSQVTPLRKSTTKNKMEVARRRSASKSLNISLEKAANSDSDSDSDSDNVPLSQISHIHKQQLKNFAANILQKSQHSVSFVADVLNQQQANLKDGDVIVKPFKRRSLSMAHLNRVDKQKLEKLLTPPRLRLRPRKNDSAASQRKLDIVDKSVDLEVLNQHHKSIKEVESVIAEMEVGELSSGIINNAPIVTDSENVDIILDSEHIEDSVSPAKKESRSISRKFWKDSFRNQGVLSPVAVRLRSSSKKLRARSHHSSGIRSPKRHKRIPVNTKCRKRLSGKINELINLCKVQDLMVVEESPPATQLSEIPKFLEKTEDIYVGPSHASQDIVSSKDLEVHWNIKAIGEKVPSLENNDPSLEKQAPPQKMPHITNRLQNSAEHTTHVPESSCIKLNSTTLPDSSCKIKGVDFSLIAGANSSQVDLFKNKCGHNSDVCVCGSEEMFSCSVPHDAEITPKTIDTKVTDEELLSVPHSPDRAIESLTNEDAELKSREENISCVINYALPHIPYASHSCGASICDLSEDHDSFSNKLSHRIVGQHNINSHDCLTVDKTVEIKQSTFDDSVSTFDASSDVLPKQVVEIKQSTFNSSSNVLPKQGVEIIETGQEAMEGNTLFSEIVNESNCLSNDIACVGTLPDDMEVRESNCLSDDIACVGTLPDDMEVRESNCLSNKIACIRSLPEDTEVRESNCVSTDIGFAEVVSDKDSEVIQNNSLLTDAAVVKTFPDVRSKIKEMDCRPQNNDLIKPVSTVPDVLEASSELMALERPNDKQVLREVTRHVQNTITCDDIDGNGLAHATMSIVTSVALHCDSEVTNFSPEKLEQSDNEGITIATSIQNELQCDSELADFSPQKLQQSNTEGITTAATTEFYVSKVTEFPLEKTEPSRVQSMTDVTSIPNEVQYDSEVTDFSPEKLKQSDSECVTIVTSILNEILTAFTDSADKKYQDSSPSETSGQGAFGKTKEASMTPNSLKYRAEPSNSSLSNTKMAHVRRLQHRLPAMSDRGMKMVRRSLLQQQVCDVATAMGDVRFSTKDPEEELGNRVAQQMKSAQNLSPAPLSPTGILKRRHLLAEIGAMQDSSPLVDSPSFDSPSPGKKRRVSFANPIVSGESPPPPHKALSKNAWRRELNLSRVASPMPFIALPSATTSVTVYKTHAKLLQKLQKIGASEDSKTSSLSDCSVSELSQNSYHSTQESQLNNQDPIFPPLVNCDKPVKIILPQLTTSIWHRGLCQLMKARSVVTIGDLARLSEMDVQNMPVRSPKVEVVRVALQNFFDRHTSGTAPKKADTTSQESKNAKGAVWDNITTLDEDDEVLPCVDDALMQLSPIKGGDFNSSIEEQDEEYNHPHDSEVVHPKSKVCTLPQNDLTVVDNTLLKRLTSLVEAITIDDLKLLNSADLFDIHQHLSTLSSLVVSAIKHKCHSPPKL